MSLQLVRGTRDLFGEDILRYNYIVYTARRISELYNFKEIMTPIFEFSDVFEKNLGDTSDVVLKEIYKFKDKGDNYLSLRPEFTAGIVRAILNHSELSDSLPIKLFSQGPVFRYDRPQKGRQRQFSQINFEYFGNASPMGDVDIIAMATNLLKNLELQKVVLEINSLGSRKSRSDFEDSLKTYLTGYKDELSQDSKIRLDKNVLRILDSKDDNDRKILENAPRIGKYYSKDDEIFFSTVKEKLSLLNIEFTVNELLVRGLDYYTSTVFEFTADSIGAQSTVMAGGRYDELVEKMGGRNVPAVGCAAGVERLMLMLDRRQQEIRPVSVVPISDGELAYCLKFSENLRKNGIPSELNSEGSVKNKMNLSNRNHSKFAIVIGEEEVRSGLVTLKNLDRGSEEKVVAADILQKLSRENDESL
ncbi:MAG: histidine--tRNA ligase [Rickettsiales bacterium]|jgi:histidyl-tRNA synthetase|nr:histidine--tRNA ligase [Rickettsiales bacterium]